MRDISAKLRSLLVRADQLLTRRVSMASPGLDRREIDRFAKRAHYAKAFVSERESYLSQAGVDAEIFGTHWGREYLDTVASLVGAANHEMLNRLRLIYNFSGFPIVSYRRSETFPKHDPVFERYLRLRQITPRRFRFAAPSICGEAGWRIDRGIVNVDVALAQERLQFMYFGGALDWLDQQPQPVSIIEIGAGCGLMALALRRAYPSGLYLICDVPEVLTVSFAYLNLAIPNDPHIAVLPSGCWDVARHEKIDLKNVANGVVYIPNYMMHRHSADLTCDMAVNAMSLHEMRLAQIAYYSNFMAEAVRDRGGFYFDINAHRGETNKKNDNLLSRAFSLCTSIDLNDLSLGARVWSNSSTTMEKLKKKSDLYRNEVDLERAFSIEHPFEQPRFSPEAAYKALNEDLGVLLKVDFESWMKARRYNFADPLAGYRARHGSRQ